MSVSLQVLYPVAEGTSFNFDYYLSKHMEIVNEHMGPHIASTVITKGLAGGPDAPAGYHAVATLVFDNQDALGAAMDAAGPALADIPNFTNSEPQMLVGEVVG